MTLARLKCATTWFPLTSAGTLPAPLVSKPYDVFDVDGPVLLGSILLRGEREREYRLVLIKRRKVLERVR